MELGRGRDGAHRASRWAVSKRPSLEAARARLQWYTGDPGCSRMASLKPANASANLPALYWAVAQLLALPGKHTRTVGSSATVC